MGVSERRACRVLGQPRATQQYQPQIRTDEARLRRRLRVLARRHRRYGYRRIIRLLRDEGWRVNGKRVHRLWHLEGLQVPVRRRRKRRRGPQRYSHLRASAPNQVWCYDFVLDHTDEGRPVRLLSVVDEYTRECLALPAARHFPARAVVATLSRLVAARGAPQYLRSDNGPEFIARVVQTWLATAGVETVYIPPGCPWENPFVESFHSRLRDECLSQEVFASLLEIQVLAEAYRLRYNQTRPHSALGYVPPAVFAARWRADAAGTPASVA